MRKTISTLSAVIFSTVLSAQVSLHLDYDFMDGIIATNAGADYKTWGLEINNAYNIGNADMGNLAEVRFDSLVEFDYDTGMVINTYPLAESTIRVDSFDIYFTHVNHSGTNNVITVSIYQGGEPTDSTGHSGAMIWTRSINTTTSLSVGYNSFGNPNTVLRSFFPGITLSQGQYFSIRLTFSGSVSQDTLSLLTGHRDNCNDGCSGGNRAYIPNSSSYVHVTGGIPGGYLLLPPDYSVYYDCNGNSVHDPNGCEEYYTQNFLIDAFVTLTSTGYDVSMGDTHTTCSGTFYDSGGFNGVYGPFEDYTITFTSATPGQQIRMAFLQFTTESSDDLKVYDGTTTSHSLIGEYDGTYNPFDIISTSGSLTFRFTSSGTGGGYPGWWANISCISSTVAIANPSPSNGEIANVSIYPNPNVGSFMLQIEGYESPEPLTLELFTPDARRIYEEIIPAQTDIRKSMEFINLNKGLYLFRISNEREQMLKKLTISR